MCEQLRALLRRVGYTDAARETAVMRKYRALLTRSDPDADEVTLLRGLWYQLAWAVEQVPERLPGPRRAAGGRAGRRRRRRPTDERRQLSRAAETGAHG